MISIPFSGSKRYSYKAVRKIVEGGGYKRVYEPFGGSAVLSVNLFNDGIVEEAFINDFDGLFDIYGEYLDYKDWLVEKCWAAGFLRRVTRAGAKDRCVKKNRNDEVVAEGKPYELPKHQQEYLQSLVARIPKKYWRLLTTGGNFTFSAKSTEPEIRLCFFKYFSAYLKTDRQRRYLETVKRINRDRLDYREYLKRHAEEFDRDSILILDPPYVDTEQGQYNGTFTEDETVNLLKAVKALGIDFIFFNHDPERIKSWLDRAGFTEYEMSLTGSKATSSNRNRLDVMVYVNRKTDRKKRRRLETKIGKESSL